MRAIRAWSYSFSFLWMLTVVNPCLIQAQSGTSSALSGGVTDPSGAAVPNATVTHDRHEYKSDAHQAKQMRPAIFSFPRSILALIRSRSRPRVSPFRNLNPPRSVLAEQSH